MNRRSGACVWLVLLVAATSRADDRAQRLLLIGQGPDNHKPTTHEYMPAMALMSSLLARVDGVQTVVVRADGNWEGGPDLVDSADGVFLFVSQGAKWLSDDPHRLAAFRRLARRKGGLACWHWGMGTQSAEPIANFVQLFGGCHGGPDRKHRVMDVSVRLAAREHPVLSGIKPFDVREEFYYALKFGADPKRIQPLLQIEADGGTHTVCWAWQRPDGGRSFGFSGGHFHDRWRMPEYRRLAVQGALWTLGRELPQPPDVSADEQLLRLIPRRETK